MMGNVLSVSQKTKLVGKAKKICPLSGARMKVKEALNPFYPDWEMHVVTKFQAICSTVTQTLTQKCDRVREQDSSSGSHECLYTTAIHQKVILKG